MGTSASNADAQPDSSPRDQSPTRGRNRSSSQTTPEPHIGAPHLVLNRPYAMTDRSTTLPVGRQQTGSVSPVRTVDEEDVKEPASTSPPAPVRCINPASEVNARLDTQVEVKVYPCNNSQSSSGKKKFTSFTVKPEVSLCLSFIMPVIVFFRGYR